MPNQPKTPNRSIRIDHEAWTRANAAMAEAGRKTADAVRAFVDAIGVTGEAELAAFDAAEQAGWFDVHMPRAEAHRRLTAALDAARPHFWRAWSEMVAETLEGSSQMVTMPDGSSQVVVPWPVIRRTLTG